MTVWGAVGGGPGGNWGLWVVGGREEGPTRVGPAASGRELVSSAGGVRGGGQKVVVHGKLQGGLGVGRVLLIRGNLGVLGAGLRLGWCVLRNLWDRRGGWLLSERAGRAKHASREQELRKDEKFRF